MSMPAKIRAAAVQIEAVLGDVDANLEKCHAHASAAAAAGAEWIALPEFFSTGVAYLPALAEKAAAPDGAPTQLLVELARTHGAHVGGSALVRDGDGHVRNAFLLANPEGEIVGRHDKDLPTMWENALYTGGTDPGLFEAADMTVGVALCWEMLRHQTLDRLAGHVDLVVGGSGWWSVPEWPFMRGTEERNARRATQAPSVFARHVGAPVIHGAHAGAFTCPFPATPITYRGYCEGGAQVCDAEGNILAYRDRLDGDGFALASVTVGRTTWKQAPDRFWFQRRGALAATVWAYQGVHGRRAYRRSGNQSGASASVSVSA